jgi:hypothetical protein
VQCSHWGSSELKQTKSKVANWMWLLQNTISIAILMSRIISSLCNCYVEWFQFLSDFRCIILYLLGVLTHCVSIFRFVRYITVAVNLVYRWCYWRIDRISGLVVRVPGYRSRDPGFDSRRYQIFWEIVILERGPLSLMRIIEEVLEGTVAAPV